VNDSSRAHTIIASSLRFRFLRRDLVAEKVSRLALFIAVSIFRYAFSIGFAAPEYCKSARPKRDEPRRSLILVTCVPVLAKPTVPRMTRDARSAR
jgi:hypothetical protein